MINTAEVYMAPALSVAPAVEAARVLIVEDHADTRTALHLALRQAFPGILLAPDGAAAMQLLAEHEDIGVVLADQRMPGMCGETFLAETARHFPRVVRILFTAYHEDDLEARVVQAGIAHDYLQKPVEPDVLGAVLHSALDRYARYAVCSEACDECIDPETEEELTKLRAALKELTADERGA